MNKIKDQFENYLKDHQVSEEQRIKRLSICEMCVHNVIKLNVHTCDECNCILALKVRMKQSHCPLDFW